MIDGGGYLNPDVSDQIFYDKTGILKSPFPYNGRIKRITTWCKSQSFLTMVSELDLVAMVCEWDLVAMVSEWALVVMVSEWALVTVVREWDLVAMVSK